MKALETFIQPIISRITGRICPAHVKLVCTLNLTDNPHQCPLNKTNYRHGWKKAG